MKAGDEETERLLINAITQSFSYLRLLVNDDAVYIHLCKFGAASDVYERANIIRIYLQ